MKNDTSVRSIKKVWKSQPVVEGAGVHLRRAFGFREMPELDPFLLLDDFRSENPDDYRAGFPWHPHRGMETITYLLDGEVEHQDSLKNKGVIQPGDVQWMTAGGGIIHQEMPRGDRKGRMAGFQLWSNLPAASKMMDPRYREVKDREIPVVKTPDGATVRVIAGDVEGQKGPVRDIVSGPEYLDVSVPKGKSFAHPVKPDHTVFAYVFEGEGFFDAGRDPFAREDAVDTYADLKRPCSCGDGSVVLYGPGSSVVVSTDKKPVRFLLVSGRPLKEPIAWYGPIVMNTQEELKTAFREFQEGTFVKARGEKTRR
jgi:redox-sensitive bicupin YhaK (pirin superfamily)